MEDWMKQGIYRLLDIGLEDSDNERIEWTSKDKEFGKTYLNRIGKGEVREVRVAVLDCGISKKGYLNERGQLSGFYKPNGIPEKGNQGAHGTFVAGRAGWGTGKIKIFDAKIGHSHQFATMNMQVVQDAMSYAVKTWKVDIICCSVNLRYDYEIQVNGQKTTLDKYIATQKNTLFVLTSANSFGQVYSYKENLPSTSERQKRGLAFPPEANHILCVGGCTREGKLHVESRWGAIDVWAPSGLYPQFYPDEKLHGGGGDKPPGLRRYGIELEAVDGREDRSPVKQSRPDRGVSFAVPMVANVAAKLKLLNPDLSAKELVETVKHTSRVTQRTTSQDNLKGEMIRQKQTVQMLDPVAVYSYDNKTGVADTISKLIGL